MKRVMRIALAIFAMSMFFVTGVQAQRFTDITENDMNGRPHKLSQYVGRGNYVLIDFWASWCGSCMEEMPNVKRNYEKYRKKGFRVVGLSLDVDEYRWKQAVRNYGLDWIHLSDLKGWKSKAARTYGIHSIPSSILVDPKGRIIAYNLLGDELGYRLSRIYGY